MANRYWVGGSATWDNTAGSKWALTSGGAGGQAVPTTSDDVFLDGASGAVTVTMNDVARMRHLSLAGFTGTLAWGGVQNAQTVGNLIGGAGATITSSGGYISLQGASATHNITSNGMTWNSIHVETGSNQVISLQDAFTSTLAMQLSGTATLTTNNFNMTFTGASGQLTSFSGDTLNFGSSTISTEKAFTFSSGLTLNAGTSTLKHVDTSATTRVFAGGGYTFYRVWFDRGTSAGINTISGSNTFTELKDTGTVAHTTRFTAGTTQTLASAAGWQISGAVGQPITITSQNTSTHALSCASGNISADYLIILHSVAGGGASWYAGANSTDSQAVPTGGSGWIFTAPPASGPANLKSYNTNLKANIKSINGNPIANVKSLNTNV